MRIAKFIFGFMFLLSLSFNAAFLLHQITAHPSSAETDTNSMQLHLTDQQKKQLEPLRMKIHQDNESIKKQILHCQKQLLTALKTKPVDKQAIYQCIDNISNLQKKIQQNTVEEIIQLRKYMDPDQCNCLMEGLGAAMHQTTKPCNCPYCQSQKSSKDK